MAPLAIVQAAELRGRISELENMPNHTAVNLHVRDRLDELTKQAQVSLWVNLL